MNQATKNMNHMVLTPQVYNLLMVSVAIFFIVYGIRSCDRFYRTLKLRAAVLSNKLIEIKGVGENLIFLDDAIFTHAMGVIHNRQVEPPRQVECCYIPYKINFVKVLPQDGSYVISLWNSVPCQVYLLINVNVAVLKSMDLTRLLANVNTKNTGHSSSLSSVFSSGSSSSPANNWVTSIFNPFCGAVTSPVTVEGNVEKANVIRLLPMMSGGHPDDGGSSAAGNGENRRTVMPGRGDDSNSSGNHGNVVINNYAVLVVPIHGSPRSSVGSSSSSSSGLSRSSFPSAELKLYTTATELPPSQSTNSSNPAHSSGDEDAPGIESIAEAGSSRVVHSTTDERKTIEVVDCDVEMGRMNMNVDARDGNPILHHPNDIPFVPLGDSDESHPTATISQVSTSSGSSSNAHSPVDGSGNRCNVNGNTTHSVSSIPMTAVLLFGLQVCTPSPSPSQPSVSNSTESNGEVTSRETPSPSVSVSEASFYCINNELFAAAEVFGTTPTFNSTPAAKTTAAATDDGDGDGDDCCVICLTDPKEALLLPCRHLCVCKSCFNQIDRCPICRNNFDKYLMLSAEETEIIETSSGGSSSYSKRTGGLSGSRRRRTQARVVKKKVMSIPPYCDDNTAAAAAADGGVGGSAVKSTVIYNEIHMD